MALLFIFFSSQAFAEACTYNEAKLALQNGNQVRGLSLMKMAANDGDDRAVSFLANIAKNQIVRVEGQSLINQDNAQSIDG